MRGRSLSLLYAAIWLASTTFALVARNPARQARADTTPEYPKGYDAGACPLSSTTITLQNTPAESEGIILPAAVTHRDLHPDELFQVCRQVGRVTVQPGPYRVQYLITSTVQPGLYVVSVKANTMIRELQVYSMTERLNSHVLVLNPLANHAGGQFQISAPVPVHIRLSFLWTHAAGELALFKLGPRNYMGPSS